MIADYGPLSRQRRVARREAAAAQQVVPAIVTARLPDGRVSVLPAASAGTCQVPAGRLSSARGEIVYTPPARGSIASSNTAGGALATAKSTAPAYLWVERVDPSTYVQGESYTVSVTGRGFEPGIVFTFLLKFDDGIEQPVQHPGIAINAATVLDSRNATLEIDVASDAELVTLGPLGFRIGGSP